MFARGQDTVIPATKSSEAWTLSCTHHGRTFRKAVTVGRGGVVDVVHACG